MNKSKIMSASDAKTENQKSSPNGNNSSQEKTGSIASTSIEVVNAKFSGSML